MKTMKRWMVALSVAAVMACGGDSETVEPAGTVDSDRPSNETASTQDEWSIAQLDGDRSGSVDRSEFDRSWSARFRDWDIDADGALDAEESATLVWELLDRDEDYVVTRSEWDRGTARWRFDGIGWGEWNGWDADGDGRLSETEWLEGWLASIWSAWDGDEDGLVSEAELSDRFWRILDANGDGLLD